MHPLLLTVLDYAKKPEIVAVLVTAVLGGAAWLLQPRARVVWGASHQFAFIVPQQNGNRLPIYTKTLFIRNVGRMPAEEVEVFLNFVPEHLQVWPTFQYSSRVNPEGHYSLVFPSLGPREAVSVEIIQSNREPPAALRVRTAQGDQKQVAMAPQLVVARWVVITIWMLMILGVYQLLSWGARLAL